MAAVAAQPERFLVPSVPSLQTTHMLTTHTAAAAALLAILDEGGDAAERVPLPPSPLRFELWTVQQTLRPGMVNVHIRTSVMLQNVSRRGCSPIRGSSRSAERSRPHSTR